MNKIRVTPALNFDQWQQTHVIEFNKKKVLSNTKSALPYGNHI